MFGPRPAGFWSTAVGPREYRHLVPGQRYTVAVPFRDYDGAEHPAGESWWYRGFNYSVHDRGLSLFVSLDGQQEWHVPLQADASEQGAVLAALEQHLVPAQG